MAVLLLVEDDSVLRDGLSELFSRDGYRVVRAGSLREARELLTDEVRIVVMDVGLPDGTASACAGNGATPEKPARFFS